MADEDQDLEENIEDARRFLAFLRERKWIELQEPETPKLLAALGELLASDPDAETVSEWLLDRDEVSELFVDDEELQALLDRW